MAVQGVVNPTQILSSGRHNPLPSRALVISPKVREMDQRALSEYMTARRLGNSSRSSNRAGGVSSSLEAIARTGWRNGGPLVDHIIVRADFIQRLIAFPK